VVCAGIKTPAGHGVSKANHVIRVPEKGRDATERGRATGPARWNRSTRTGSAPGPTPADCKGVTPEAERWYMPLKRSNVADSGMLLTVTSVRASNLVVSVAHLFLRCSNPDPRQPPGATEARQRSEGSQRAARSWGERSPGGEPDPRRSVRGSPDRGDRERHAEAQRSENRERGGAVPSAGWREVTAALDAEEGQSHGGAATIACTCGKVTPEVRQTTERGAKPVVSDE
jgi:hypothetical protein